MTHTHSPTAEETEQFAISKLRGIDVGFGSDDKVFEMASKLEEKYPMHLILVQDGGFLHAYNRSAHALSTLKKYQLRLSGSTDHPHLRAGFGIHNFKQRLWSFVKEFNTPYVVSLGTKSTGRVVYISEYGDAKKSVMSAVSLDIVSQIITDLQQNGEINVAAAKKLLKDPDTAGFKLKAHAQQLDNQLIDDLINMPRDIRAIWGENVRVCMARIMQQIYTYGLAVNKPNVLRLISADVDLLKHYLAQAFRLSKLKFSVENRVSLAVELGRLLGGVMRAAKEST